MYNSISGIISGKTHDTICLENGGIEWLIHAPFSAIQKFGKLGEAAKVFTYLHHKEDSMTLYGFFAPSQRSLFFDLIKVNGIGPKQAVRILAAVEEHQFVELINNEDVKAISRVPGIGTKTAQKIILTLKGKLTFAKEEDSVSHELDDLVIALQDMGFERAKAKKVLSRLDVGDLSGVDKEQELLRRAIIELSTQG